MYHDADLPLLRYNGSSVTLCLRLHTASDMTGLHRLSQHRTSVLYIVPLPTLLTDLLLSRLSAILILTARPLITTMSPPNSAGPSISRGPNSSAYLDPIHGEAGFDWVARIRNVEQFLDEGCADSRHLTPDQISAMEESLLEHLSEDEIKRDKVGPETPHPACFGSRSGHIKDACPRIKVLSMVRIFSMCEEPELANHCSRWGSTASVR